MAVRIWEWLSRGCLVLGASVGAHGPLWRLMRLDTGSRAPVAREAWAQAGIRGVRLRGRVAQATLVVVTRHEGGPTGETELAPVGPINVEGRVTATTPARRYRP